MAWYPTSAVLQGRELGRPRFGFGQSSSTFVIPMGEDPRAESAAALRQQIWRSILIGVGVSVGTTFVLRFLDSVFRRRNES